MLTKQKLDSKTMNSVRTSNISYNESFYHRLSKSLLLKAIISENRIIRYEFEKRIGDHRPDIFLHLFSGKKIVIEIQNSNISTKKVIQRTKFYNSLGIYTLWLVNGKGPCVISKKHPRDQKISKISSLEKYLFGLYGGRVYYLNLNQGKRQGIEVFTLYFGLPNKKEYRNKKFHTKFSSYWVRNTFFVPLRSNSILCTKCNGLKIARFYDKNFFCSLKASILTVSNQLKNKLITKGMLLKRIEYKFSPRFGKFLVHYAMFSLIKEGKLDLPKWRMKYSAKKHYKRNKGG
jgi:hypothetical protein